MKRYDEVQVVRLLQGAESHGNAAELIRREDTWQSQARR